MTPANACKFVMPIDDPNGARYLDWVVGLKDLDPLTKSALKAFLPIPWVAKLVEESMHDGRDYDEPPENVHAPRPWWEREGGKR